MEEHRRREEVAAATATAGVDGVPKRTSGRATEVRDGVELKSGVGGEEQVIRWERFLPRRFLRVLLVENDDSTRHIVAALLRKCSYRVVAVADGLKAWEVLKEKHYNFDLVLTEVVMPSLSGIGLLSKIMSNETCKNIPVIMMSSHDSIGIVFKCMMKGAADFLVKPVRKNELRILWQHVWRKHCFSNCGNGSEIGNQNKTILEAVSDNDAACNHGSANSGNRYDAGDSSGKENDTQSSCSKPETGVGSGRKPREVLESEYRSFPEEIESKSEKHDYDMAKVATTLSLHEKGKAKGKSTGLEIKGIPSNEESISTQKVWEENGSYDKFPCREEDQAMRSKDVIIDPEPLDQNEGTNEPSKEIIDFIGASTIARCCFPVVEDNDHDEDILCKNTKHSDINRSTCNSGPSQLWELSLTRPQLKGSDDEVFQEKHVLNHSDASAFSRYGGAKTAGSSSASLCIKTSESGTSNCHINSGTDYGKNRPHPLIESLISAHRNGGEAPNYCQLSSGGNKEDANPLASVSLRENACVGHSSTAKTIFTHRQLGTVPLPIPVGAIPFQNFCAGYSAMLQPIFYPEPSVPPCGSSEVGKETEFLPFNPSTQDTNHLVNDLQRVNCHYFGENQHLHQSRPGMEEQSLNIKSTYPRVIVDSGSNGSNEGTSAAVNTGTDLESGNEDGFQNCNGKGSDRDCSQREAALSRFRLKRKDRCFEKKVRYQSRKKLAEQRPRLKGQFVRQAVAESTMIAAEPNDRVDPFTKF